MSPITETTCSSESELYAHVCGLQPFCRSNDRMIIIMMAASAWVSEVKESVMILCLLNFLIISLSTHGTFFLHASSLFQILSYQA